MDTLIFVSIKTDLNLYCCCFSHVKYKRNGMKRELIPSKNILERIYLKIIS